jgi:glycine oxidase
MARGKQLRLARTADVFIVGAGAIGAAVAYELARHTNASIILADRGSPGEGASNAAAGVLAFASGQARKGALLELRRQSAAMFPAWVAALEEDTAIDLRYRTEGLIALAFEAAELSNLAELVAHRSRQGLECQVLSAEEVRQIEPGVSPSVRGGAFFSDDRSIDNIRLVQALVAAAARRGVDVHDRTRVDSIVPDGAHVRVVTIKGTVEAGTVVLAAGCWSPELAGALGVRVPLRPAHGEMVAVRARSPLRHTLSVGDTYLIPRGDEVLLGSTVRFVGFDDRVTAGGVADLIRRGVIVMPEVAQAEVVRWWSGLRPCPTIRRPIIARLNDCDRIVLATGHHRNGILLAPVTASLVRSIIEGTPPIVPLRPFGYRRR